MNCRTISLVSLAVGVACFTAGYRVGTKRNGSKPSHLAVSLVNDRFLHSVATVVQDDEGRYVLQGDEIKFLSDGPVALQSTVHPFALQFTRWDFFSTKHPRGAHTAIFVSERSKEETFIVRDGNIQKVDIIGRMTPR